MPDGAPFTFIEGMAHRFAAFLVVLAVTFGCSRSPQEVNGDFSPRDLKSVLYVQNLHWDAVRIYFVPDNGSSAERIGSVDGSSTGTIQVKGQLAATLRTRGRVRLLLRPLASTRGFVTYPVTVAPGEDLQLYVQNQLDMSYVVPAS